MAAIPVSTYSLAAMRPFVELIRTRSPDVYGALESLSKYVVDRDRIPARRAQAWLTDVLRATGDADLGLHAALHTQPGDFGIVELLGSSAHTRRAAIQAVCRYARLLNDAADYQLCTRGPEVHLVFGDSAPCNRVLVDFQLASFHLASRRRSKGGGAVFEVWMRHPAPADMRVYRAVFRDTKLVFHAEFDGFVLDAQRLDEPVPTRNLVLHRVLCDYAERLLADIGPADDLVGSVTEDIRRTLRWSDHSVERTAARLGMSRRTLTRRLAKRGTTFSALVQEVRHQTAIQYLRDTEHNVEDIARLVGYSECSAFVRAFKRWVGSPPDRFRQRLREGISI